MMSIQSIEFIDIRFTGLTECPHFGSTSYSRIYLGLNGVENSFKFLLLGFKNITFSFRILAHPSFDFFNFSLNGTKSVLDADAVVFKSILGFNSLSQFLILILEFLGLFNHFLDFFLGKSSLIAVDNSYILGFGFSYISRINAYVTILIYLD